MVRSGEPASKQPTCKRCGKCCRNGGPALHSEDLLLVKQQIISLENLVTIRENEPALNQSTSSIEDKRSEFIKLAGLSGSWSCRFWSQHESSCQIYNARPVECRLLFCKDTRAIEEIMGRDLLTRADIIGNDEETISIINKHESICNYVQMNELLALFFSERGSDNVLAEINKLVDEDMKFRDQFLAAYPDLMKREMFLFGRPFFLVLSSYGFRPVETMDGLSVYYNKAPVNSMFSAQTF